MKKGLLLLVHRIIFNVVVKKRQGRGWAIIFGRNIALEKRGRVFRIRI